MVFWGLYLYTDGVRSGWVPHLWQLDETLYLVLERVWVLRGLEPRYRFYSHGCESWVRDTDTTRLGGKSVIPVIVSYDQT